MKREDEGVDTSKCRGRLHAAVCSAESRGPPMDPMLFWVLRERLSGAPGAGDRWASLGV